MLLIILGRTNGPLSKKATAEWFNESFLKFLWKFPHKLNSQNILSNMDFLKEETMRKIEEKLAEKNDKNLVTFGIAESDANIPLMHETCPGNAQDSKLFPKIIDKLVDRRRKLKRKMSKGKSSREKDFVQMLTK